ncbi:hypothetical protein [Sphingobium nicotianae]|uniref:Uncharacterized protein n=1 Tax=Sphingobium nicotianae TaxID=2782607 RepID=A0A9X1DB78_9SPHN|nr:hypothetical protein [Sphingobium nicotianae]MBT2186573.1 hypothetical protein [Sphingobium nicotianae]
MSAAPGLATGKPGAEKPDEEGVVIREEGDMRPDFSQVTSRAAAEQLVKQGRLVRILIFPAEFGGEDVPENQTYVPPAIIEALDMVKCTMSRFIARGLIDWMSVTQAWHGESIVPARITFHCMNKGKGETKDSFTPSVDVW